MDYYCFEIAVPAPIREIALAFLAELPFDSFEETADGLNAYLPAAENLDEVESRLPEIAARLAFRYKRRFIPAENWNATWEANFQPIRIGNFCEIRASFHPQASGVAHELIINPRMAFGTGHHATTFLMIEQMEQELFSGATVLDFGCGTGILAILAEKLGAVSVDAVDIEKAAWENTVENAGINGASRIHAYHGTLQDVPECAFDIILANINRNVILNSLQSLYGRLAPGGVLLVSGILFADENLAVERAEGVGLKLNRKARREEWCCLRFVR
ncbi:MAG: 50S ribosomal protein L11 methyltransferase [Phaeodactylibacter sp.]|nr:50S ribosomal protein L11 methyltransferase [Phaeodactylibacter sp.]MCB9275801.1 50S ribosomal protein L11 methyltransferase [Lewinellaceae bacterium]